MKSVLAAGVLIVPLCFAACRNQQIASTNSNLDAPIASSSSGCNTLTDPYNTASTARVQPEWAFITHTPTLLEGFVGTSELLGLDPKAPGGDQPSNLAEKDWPFSHFNHDRNFLVIPDPGYKHLLSYSNAPEDNGLLQSPTVRNQFIEVEWENASDNPTKDPNGNFLGFSSQTGGAFPPFVWPSVGDRVWVMGRWVFDCGHLHYPQNPVAAGSSQVNDVRFVGIDTEIHPPRAVVTFRMRWAENPYLRFVDTNTNGHWDPGEPVVIDSNFDGQFTWGPGLMIAGPRRAIGTSASSMPAIKFVDLDGNNQWDVGEPLYNDTNGDGVGQSGEYIEYSPFYQETRSDGQTLRSDDRFRVHSDNSGLSLFLVAHGSAVNTPYGLVPDFYGTNLPFGAEQILNSVPVPPNGSPVSVDPHILHVDRNYNGVIDNNEPIVYDADGDGKFTAGTHDALINPSTKVTVDEGEQLSNPNSFASPLPVTGTSQPVAATEANIFVSGQGGAVGDECVTLNLGYDLANNDYAITCEHRKAWKPVNDINYVFDVYPPGTDFEPSHKLLNGTFPVRVPTRDGTGTDVSLQFSLEDRSDQIPTRGCNGVDLSSCVKATPIFCLVDSSTPAPNQSETSCPPAPARPTRLRVILPFVGTSANVFAGTVRLGWDDVAPAGDPLSVRQFNVTLRQLDIINNGESQQIKGDWRLIVGVGNRWTYWGDIPWDPDSTATTPLTNNPSGHFYRYANHPISISVVDGTPIHLSMSGYDSDLSDGYFCHSPGNSACDIDSTVFPETIGAPALDDKLPGLEAEIVPQFRARAGASYIAPAPIDNGTTPDSLTEGPGGISTSEEYRATFKINSSPMVILMPTSLPLAVGTPDYVDSQSRTFVTSATPISMATSDGTDIQYRFYRSGTPLPVFSSNQPFPLHWNEAPQPVSVELNGFDGNDGQYLLQYSARYQGQTTEPRHTAILYLDNTPPSITVAAPMMSGNYDWTTALVLNYSADDGMGSGVQSVSALLDGSPTLAGHGLSNGQSIDLLFELSLGTHVLAVSSSDNLGNADTDNVSFNVIITRHSIITMVERLTAMGEIKHPGTEASLIAKLQTAASKGDAGDCQTAANIDGAFINEVQAAPPGHISALASSLLIQAAQYLIAHCP